MVTPIHTGLCADATGARISQARPSNRLRAVLCIDEIRLSDAKPFTSMSRGSASLCSAAMPLWADVAVSQRSMGTTERPRRISKYASIGNSTVVVKSVAQCIYHPYECHTPTPRNGALSLVSDAEFSHGFTLAFP